MPKKRAARVEECSRCKTSEAKGLGELRISSIPMNFIKQNNGCWDYARWFGFLEEIREKGYDIDDADEVGLLLESEKEQYFAQQDRDVCH